MYGYLKSKGGKLGENLAVKMILSPFMEGIHHLHENGIIHRDIKVRVCACVCLGKEIAANYVGISGELKQYGIWCFDAYNL